MFAKLLKVAVVSVSLLGSAEAMAGKRPNFTPREVTGTININAASLKELELLPGVGHRAAGLIVAYREKSPFKTAQEISKVKGIGKRTFAKIKPYLAVSGPTTLAVAARKGAPGAPVPDRVEAQPR